MTADWRTRIDGAVDDSMERIVALRRQLHAHPEPSGEECKPACIYNQLFDELGLGVRMGRRAAAWWSRAAIRMADGGSRCGPISMR